MTHRPIKPLRRRTPNLSRMDRPFTLRVEPMAPARTRTSADVRVVSSTSHTEHAACSRPPRMVLAASNVRVLPILPAAGDWSHPHGLSRISARSTRTRRRLCDRSAPRAGRSAPAFASFHTTSRGDLPRLWRGGITPRRSLLLAPLAPPAHRCPGAAVSGDSAPTRSGPDVRPGHEGRNAHGHRAHALPARRGTRLRPRHLRRLRAVAGLQATGGRPCISLCQTRASRGDVAARGPLDLRSQSSARFRTPRQGGLA